MVDVVSIPPEEVAALLAVPQDEFVAARTARVKEVRAAGDRPLATALGKIRKPLRLVWVVGELARRHPEVAEAAGAVAEELEAAQAAGGGVRPLLKRFRDVVSQVAELADELDGPVDRLEVGLALREVLADPDARAAWLGGVLLALPGDEDDDAVTVAPARPPLLPASGGVKEGATADDEAATREREAAERRRAHEAALVAAEADVEAAASAHEEAIATRDEAAAELVRLEDELAALESRVAEARSEGTTLEVTVDDAARRLAEATTARDGLADVNLT